MLKYPVIGTCWNCGETFLKKERRIMYCSKSCGNIARWKNGTLSLPTQLKLSHNMTGKNNPNWRVGIYDSHRQERKNFEAKRWREAVFEKDDYRCFGCGQCDAQLDAHHKYPWAHYPRLRHDTNNGITLCRSCHDLISKRLKGPDNIVAPAGMIFSQ